MLPASGQAANQIYRWRGIALGARAEILLHHTDKRAAEDIFARMEGEIRRLESIFSLYKRGSELSRLNAEGQLDAPSAELLELLSLAGRVHTLTGGAFDPTVQPLWSLYARRYSSRQVAPTASEIAKTRRLVDFRAVSFDPQRVRFANEGMALTFNGIAQGFITDRVSTLLKALGFENVLVDLGEIAASGTGNLDGEGWQITLRPGDDEEHTKALKNQAVATSSISGTSFDQNGTVSHILDPRTGLPAKSNLQGASVIAKAAAVADSLSTAALVCGEDKLRPALKEIPGTSAFILRENGQKAHLNG